MHLYIEKGKQKKLLTVELVDGYIPSVVGYSEARQTRLSDSLEPASWFKVMVVASISIDCEKYVIHWTVNSSGTYQYVVEGFKLFCCSKQYSPTIINLESNFIFIYMVISNTAPFSLLVMIIHCWILRVSI